MCFLLLFLPFFQKYKRKKSVGQPERRVKNHLKKKIKETTQKKGESLAPLLCARVGVCVLRFFFFCSTFFCFFFFYLAKENGFARNKKPKQRKERKKEEKRTRETRTERAAAAVAAPSRTHTHTHTHLHTRTHQQEKRFNRTRIPNGFSRDPFAETHTHTHTHEKKTAKTASLFL